MLKRFKSIQWLKFSQVKLSIVMNGNGTQVQITETIAAERL